MGADLATAAGSAAGPKAPLTDATPEQSTGISTMRRLMRRLLAGADRNPQQGPTPSPTAVLLRPDLPIPYSWVLTNRLAIGPMPTSEAHWQQLEAAGLRSRFSCCYPHEQSPAAVPAHWRSERFALPDHRRQERLDPQQLAAALDLAEQLLDEGPPLYLHCLAGIERSPLMAVGLTARQRGMDIYSALDWVRRCHPAALPIYGHLELLERVIKS